MIPLQNTMLEMWVAGVYCRSIDAKHQLHRNDSGDAKCMPAFPQILSTRPLCLLLLMLPRKLALPLTR